MRIKFLDPYADPDATYKAGREYDFIDLAKARRFIDQGIAVPVQFDQDAPAPAAAEPPLGQIDISPAPASPGTRIRKQPKRKP